MVPSPLFQLGVVALVVVLPALLSQSPSDQRPKRPAGDNKAAVASVGPKLMNLSYEYGVFSCTSDRPLPKGIEKRGFSIRGSHFHSRGNLPILSRGKSPEPAPKAKNQAKAQPNQKRTSKSKTCPTIHCVDFLMDKHQNPPIQRDRSHA